MAVSLNTPIPTQPEQWDGDWRLLDFDPIAQISEWWHWNGNGSFTIRKVQHNVDAILDANAEDRSENLNSRWGDGRKIARIPQNVFEGLGLDRALAEGDTKHFKRVLNDPDYRKLRTFEGQI